MTAEPEIQAHPEPAQTGRLGDVVIVTAMVLVAIAIGIGLSLHLDLPMTRSAIAGGLILALMLGLHFFILRAPAVTGDATDLNDEAMWQDLKARRTAGAEASANDTQDASTKDREPELVMGAAPTTTASPRRSRIIAAQPQPQPEATDSDGRQGDGPWPDRIAARLRGSLNPDDDKAQPSGLQSNAPATAPKAQAEGTVANDKSISSYWSYRPTVSANEPTLTSPSVDDAQADPPSAGKSDDVSLDPTPAPPLEPAHVETGPVSPRAHDVELVQRMIKKLAQDVNAAELLASGASAGAAAAMPTDGESRAAKGIETSVDALRTTGDVMRGRPATPPRLPSAPPPAPSSVASKPGEDQQRYRRVNELSDAIKDNRLAVQLEPVIGLEDHRARHFEVTISVKSSSGSLLDEPQAGTTFQGTGLLPHFDRERLAKTYAVATQLGQRGKVGGVFSYIFGESLTDREFCFNVAASGISDESFAKRLILTLPQSHARAFGAGQWQTLHEFRELGFRFALSALTDLDMDFERLVAAGFAFVKLDAEVFFNGLHVTDGGFVPADDISRYLSSFGLSLIVENIDDSDKLARLYDNGVLLGQGQLFGGRRTLKAEALTGHDHQAA